MKQTFIMRTLFFFLVSSFIMGGCSFPFLSHTTTQENKTDRIANTVVDANNQLAIDLYFQYTDKKDVNIFFSPFSISSALTMTYEGAKGKTEDEMQKVLHLPQDQEKNRASYAQLFQTLNKYQMIPTNDNKNESNNNINSRDTGDHSYSRYFPYNESPPTPVQLSTANALWTQKDFTFLDTFLQTVAEYYNGKATNLDFKTDPEGSRNSINQWVEDQTNHRIKDLIPSGLITPFTRLVLTNAIYFKGAWATPFEKESTADKDFRISSTQTIKIPTMHQTDDFPYMENNQLQMVELPYTGNEVSMLVLLPKNDHLSELENSLTIHNLLEWQKQLKNQKVEIYLPKFQFETKYMMAEDLKKMGMKLAFSDIPCQADFSGVTGGNNTDPNKCLAINEVIHKTLLM
jgi:serpin B